jgi:hypothetical protein
LQTDRLITDSCSGRESAAKQDCSATSSRTIAALDLMRCSRVVRGAPLYCGRMLIAAPTRHVEAGKGSVALTLDPETRGIDTPFTRRHLRDRKATATRSSMSPRPDSMPVEHACGIEILAASWAPAARSSESSVDVTD